MYHRCKVMVSQLLNNTKVQVAFILITVTIMALSGGAPHNYGG